MLMWIVMMLILLLVLPGATTISYKTLCRVECSLAQVPRLGTPPSAGAPRSESPCDFSMGPTLNTLFKRGSQMCAIELPLVKASFRGPSKFIAMSKTTPNVKSRQRNYDGNPVKGKLQQTVHLWSPILDHETLDWLTPGHIVALNTRDCRRLLSGAWIMMSHKSHQIAAAGSRLRMAIRKTPFHDLKHMAWLGLFWPGFGSESAPGVDCIQQAGAKRPMLRGGWGMVEKAWSCKTAPGPQRESESCYWVSLWLAVNEKPKGNQQFAGSFDLGTKPWGDITLGTSQEHKSGHTGSIILADMKETMPAIFIWVNYNISPAWNKVVAGAIPGHSPHKPPFGVRSCEVVIIHPVSFKNQWRSRPHRQVATSPCRVWQRKTKRKRSCWKWSVSSVVPHLQVLFWRAPWKENEREPFLEVPQVAQALNNVLWIKYKSPNKN